jgi:hypothetical protein
LKLVLGLAVLAQITLPKCVSNRDKRLCFLESNKGKM